MRHTRSALTTALLVLSLCFPCTALGNPRLFATAPEPVAQIQSILINGAPVDTPTVEQLEVKRASGTTEPGRVGLQLFKDDEVKTGALVEINVVYEKPDTDYHVQVGMQENSRARIGSLWSYFGRFLISGWGSFDTQTQEVRLGKRGTEFYIDVNEDGSVNLKVLEGEVDVERVTTPPPPEELDYSHARGPVEKITVNALEGVEIKKGEPPPPPRKLEKEEVETVLNKTDKLMIASLASITPLNVLPTSYKLEDVGSPDPQNTRAAAQNAFTTARHAAILNRTAENIAALGAAYKDLGAGKRAVREYELAASKEKKLDESVEFVAGQAEAYRLAGNLKKAREKSEAAVKLSERPETTAFEKQLALTARGNSAYDQAIQYVAAGDWVRARPYFNQTKASFESATAETPTGGYKWITDRNLINAQLALDANTASSPGISQFMGTYRGVVSFPGADVAGPATIVINGSRFSLIHCEARLTGGIVPREQIAGDAFLVDLILDTSNPVKKLRLKAQMLDDKRLVLSSATGEANRFTFSTAVRQTPLTCNRASFRKIN